MTLGLLGAQGRALTLDQVRATVHDPLEYAWRHDLPLTRHIDLDSDDGVRRALHELERHHVVVHHAAGPDPVFVIGPDQHLAAAFYRNTVIHFFLHGALAQAALTRAVSVTWPTPWRRSGMTALVAGRDLLKFEFFFEPREEFRPPSRPSWRPRTPTWEQRASASGPDGVRDCSRRCGP